MKKLEAGHAEETRLLERARGGGSQNQKCQKLGFTNPTLKGSNCFVRFGKEIRGEDLCKVLTVESCFPDHRLFSLELTSEHSALEAINRLGAVELPWKKRITELHSTLQKEQKQTQTIQRRGEFLKSQFKILNDKLEARASEATLWSPIYFSCRNQISIFRRIYGGTKVGQVRRVMFQQNAELVGVVSQAFCNSHTLPCSQFRFGLLQRLKNSLLILQKKKYILKLQGKLVEERN